MTQVHLALTLHNFSSLALAVGTPVLPVQLQQPSPYHCPPLVSSSQKEEEKQGETLCALCALELDVILRSTALIVCLFIRTRCDTALNGSHCVLVH